MGNMLIALAERPMSTGLASVIWHCTHGRPDTLDPMSTLSCTRLQPPTILVSMEISTAIVCRRISDRQGNAAHIPMCHSNRRAECRS